MKNNSNGPLLSTDTFYDSSVVFTGNRNDLIPGSEKGRAPLRNALVLSGGSVKGCFQAGAIQAVIEAGFVPDIIYGVSVGSLNGAFLVNAAGKKLISKQAPLNLGDWKEIGASLVNFWLNHIQSPNDIAIQRGVVGSVLHILMHRFNGLSDTSPIKSKIGDILDLDAMRRAPITLKVGTVDFNSGKLLYKGANDNDFISYLEGSFAIPIAMPPFISAKGEVLFDGGVREVTPLGVAINDGAENIVAILCQSGNLDTNSNFNEKDLIKLVDRLEDIIVNQNVKNDSEWITYINKVITEARDFDIPSLKDYKLIKHLIIQPRKQLNIDITSFTAVDIVENVMMGYETAKGIFNAKPVKWLA